jgi:hypothetical protein
MYTPFQPKNTNSWKLRCYVNQKVELTKRKRQFLDPEQPWEEPIPTEYIYILWKDTGRMERIKVREFTIDDDTEIYLLNGKKLIIPLTNNKKPSYDGNSLGVVHISKELRDFILSDF